MKKILIVGAGFSGSVIARILADKNFNITLIDKRNHIGGNCYDYLNKHNIRIHKYGPHLFHTNNLKVVNWLKKYSKWVEYKHRVKAILDNGSYVTLPVNKKTANIVGKDKIIETLYRPYSEKMWGVPLEKISKDILNRVPIRDDDNELYFPNDKFQLIPQNGYTELFKNILDHRKIKILLNCEYSKNLDKKFDFVFNSMPIDEYFNFSYGELPYRSIKFHHINLPIPKLLPTTTVNFTNNGPYTRITEWKHITNNHSNKLYTSLTYEEPCDYKKNNFERYYPIKDIEGNNRNLYTKYQKKIPKNTFFIGRCGMYVYLDMHQAISSSIATANNFLKNN